MPTISTTFSNLATGLLVDLVIQHSIQFASMTVSGDFHSVNFLSDKHKLSCNAESHKRNRLSYPQHGSFVVDKAEHKIIRPPHQSVKAVYLTQRARERRRELAGQCRYFSTGICLCPRVVHAAIAKKPRGVAKLATFHQGAIPLPGSDALTIPPSHTTVSPTI